LRHVEKHKKNKVEGGRLLPYCREPAINEKVIQRASSEGEVRIRSVVEEFGRSTWPKLPGQHASPVGQRSYTQASGLSVFEEILPAVLLSVLVTSVNALWSFEEESYLSFIATTLNLGTLM
jgi:hypothetical protein